MSGEHVIAPLPGFDWTKVQWRAPNAPRTERCSYCSDELAEESVPLIIWNEAGGFAEFCDHCQATWWGMSWHEGQVEPRHEPEVRGAVRACRVCGCTDDRACPGGCFWVDADLCSACALKDHSAVLPRDHPDAPKYWRNETSGVLAAAVEAYLFNAVMAPEHIAVLRDYLREWVGSPVWSGPRVDFLREKVEELTSRAAIDRWIDIAVDEGLDPL